MKTTDLTHTIIDTLEEKKGEDIVLIDVQEIVDFTDYFVICSGTSDRMLDALADATLRTIKTEYKMSAGKEGQSADGWVLIDFGDVIVHIFTPDQREYYQLEKLWDKGKVLVHLQ